MDPIFKQLQKITLNNAERVSVRNTLLAFIQKNPVRTEPPVRHLYQESILSALFNNKSMTAKLIASLLVAASAGSGVSYAAEGSLPGDLLYPVKIHVNETARAAITFSAESKAGWDVRRAERRLEEAEELAAEGRLNAETRRSIEGNLKTYTDSVRRGIVELKLDNNAKAGAEVSSQLEASLRAHERILTELGDEKETVRIDVGPILLKVRSEAKDATRARVEAEDNFSIKASTNDVEAAARGKLQAAENKISEVTAFIASKKESSDAAATADAEARLKVAENVIIEGKARLDAEDYGEAFAAFQKAHRTAEEAKLLVNARSNFKIKFNLKEHENASSTSDENDDDNTKVEIKSKGNMKLKIGI